MPLFAKILEFYSSQGMLNDDIAYLDPVLEELQTKGAKIVDVKISSQLIPDRHTIERIYLILYEAEKRISVQVQSSTF